MSEFDIQGGSAIFETDVLGDMLPLVCVKSWSLNTITDSKEITTDGSGLWKDFDYDRLSYQLNLTGLAQIFGDDGSPTFLDLEDAQVQFLEVGFRLLYIDDAGNPSIKTGTVIIGSSLFDATPAKLLNSSITLIGKGQLSTHRPNETNSFTFRRAGVSFTSANNLTAITNTYKISDAVVMSTSAADEEQGLSVRFLLPKGSGPNYADDYSGVNTVGIENLTLVGSIIDTGTHWQLTYTFDYVPATANKSFNFLLA